MSVYNHIFMCMYIFYIETYIYIYTHRARKRERESERQRETYGPSSICQDLC